MKFDYVHLKRNPHQSALPPAQEAHRGDLRVLTGDGVTTTDELYFGRNRAGTLEFSKLVTSTDVPNLIIQNDDATVGSTASVLDFSTDFAVSESPTSELNIDLTMAVTLTLGPFFLNDVPGTATTSLTLQFFNTATATGIGTTGAFSAPLAGKVIGAFLNSDSSRTAGSASLRPTVNGAGGVLGSANPALDATNPLRHSVLVPWASGIAFSAGQRIGCELVTSGWTPTTANVIAFLVIGVNP